MIEEIKYTTKIPTGFVDVEKSKFMIATGNNKQYFLTREEAEKYEREQAKKLEAVQILALWRKLEIGDNEYYFIVNESTFKTFQDAWKLGYSRYNYCPSETPDKFPTLLYHYYWNNPNGKDDDEFRFIDPYNIFDWLLKNLKGSKHT